MPRIGHSNAAGGATATSSSSAAANKSKEKDAQQGNGYHANAAPSGVFPRDGVNATKFNLQEMAGKIQDVNLDPNF